jgi:aspartyl-tRNA(Asn)/glutamyl-tRNA(Gln) amidotransferase subunit C
MISVDEVKKIARLSCLELSEEEIEQYAKEFSTILEHFEVLKTAELGEEVKEQSIHLPAEGREDERKTSPVSPQDFSPYLENGFFKVPRVIDSGS